MIIIPPGQMSQADISELRKNEICVVVAKDPARVKFVDPIPAQSNRTEIEDASIKLSRILLNGNWRQYWNADSVSQSGAAHIFIQCLVKGTPLDPNGTHEEREKNLYDSTRRDEIERIAREDARAERAAKKKALFEESLKKPEEKKA